MTRRRPWLVLPLLGALAYAPGVPAASRHLAVVLDTSGSMDQNDRQRYTMQLSQVLSDLLDTGDELAVIRMPREFFSSCSEGPSPSLVLKLDPADRANFKSELDRLIRFDTGTFFAAPIRTALSLLPSDPAAQRMLLVIADSGGLGDCEGPLTQELLQAKQRGVTIAAINLGGTEGAFDTNPAFDFTTKALDAQGLIEAVALVYQRFLGGKRVQTGRVQNEIAVDIAPYAGEAYLVVAADGPVGEITQISGNPTARAIDLNHRGGGQTRGLDGVLRGYRIVRLERPSAGRWRFRASGVTDRAGWMLLQDSAIGARLVSSPTVPKDVAVPVEIELFDQRTGLAITDLSSLPALQTELEIDGRKLAFHDDGKDGDRRAGDGILTATATFNRAGPAPMAVHIQNDVLDRRVPMAANVITAAWLLQVSTPKRADVDRPVPLTVALQPIGAAGSLHLPDRIDALADGGIVALHDDGRGEDRQAADRTFTGTWTPREVGTSSIQYSAIGGSVAATVSAPVEVMGRLRLGRPVPVRIGNVGSESEKRGLLDLTGAEVRGAFDLKVSSLFKSDRAVLEADLGNGWIALGSQPAKVRLVEGGPKTWPVRLRAGECPAAYPAGQPFEVIVEATGADGRPLRMAVPVSAAVIAEPWLRCWWPVVAALLGLLSIAVLIHGYWSPSRFPPRLGVLLSPEEDPDEGFFHPIRAQRASRSGFYRDARIYICQDFRLAGKTPEAIARLRANRKQVRIESVSGAAVWRRSADGVWEQIPAGESTARFGDLYRNDPGNLFFELRNA
jgi:hypothetical protein